MCMYIYIQIYIYIYVDIHLYTFIHIHVHIYTPSLLREIVASFQNQYIYTYHPSYICIYIHIYIYIYIHTILDMRKCSVNSKRIWTRSQIQILPPALPLQHHPLPLHPQRLSTFTQELRILKCAILHVES